MNTTNVVALIEAQVQYASKFQRALPEIRDTFALAVILERGRGEEKFGLVNEQERRVLPMQFELQISDDQYAQVRIVADMLAHACVIVQMTDSVGRPLRAPSEYNFYAGSMSMTVTLGDKLIHVVRP